MNPATTLFLSTLAQPETASRRSLEEWDLLVRIAQVGSLAARMHHLLGARGALAQLPERVRQHLDSAETVSARQHEMVRWEVAQIHRALYPRGIPIVLLKGAAYVMAGLPCAQGRLLADVDILVPHAALPETERSLLVNGWTAQGYDAYDQAYYRKWMHELPALTHVRRKSVLDVHHTILPPTAHLKPDARKLLAAAVPIQAHDDVYVLAPTDMVLHSATHLFHDGELEHGLRDLVDLDDLLRHFAANDPHFWPALVDRAYEMDLARPLFYGLRYAGYFLGTPVPETAMHALARAAPARPLLPMVDAVFQRGLAPHHWSCDGWLSPTARWILFVRSHHLRMPLRLLVPHLVRKAIRKRTAATTPKV